MLTKKSAASGDENVVGSEGVVNKMAEAFLLDFYA